MHMCPYCGVEIIAGTDECDECGQTLTDLSIPEPATAVEVDLLRDTVQALEPHQPLSVPVDQTVGKTLQQMAADRVGCVMVVDEGNLVGIFSERDAVMKLNVDASRLEGHPISRYMTTNPETVTADDKIAFALGKMNMGGYRHMPILAAGQLSGVISIRDILRYLSQRMPEADVN